jgi:hypothetical protein
MFQSLVNRSWAKRSSKSKNGQLESTGKPFPLRTNMRYRATVTLSGIESWASNDQIADKFRDLGFKDPKVSGNWGVRKGEAVWPGEQRLVELPIDPHLSDVEEIPAAA